MLHFFKKCTLCWVLAFVLAGPALLRSQHCMGYNPIPTETPDSNAIKKSLEERFWSDVEPLNGKYKKEYVETYRERFENVKDRLSNGHFMFGDRLNAYLDNIVKEVAAANPELDLKGLRIFVGAYAWGNAASMGEGSLVINIGLLNRLENEAELAFIICHEIAHEIFKHSNEAIRRGIEVLHAQKTQKEIKKIKKSEYGGTEKAIALMKNLLLEGRKHSRDKETQADSMAIAMLLRTHYDASAAMDCLALLDSIDMDKYARHIDFQAQLDFPAMHFKKEWLKRETLGLGMQVEKTEEQLKLADSLKTHPDCMHRIDLVYQMLKTYDPQGHSVFLQPKSEFDSIYRIADLEVVESEHRFGNLGRCLYHSLQLQSVYPNEPYLKYMTSICLMEAAIAQKEHELGKMTELPSPEHADDYLDVLFFLQNIRLSELSGLAYQYAAQYKDTYACDEEFLHLMEEICTMNGKADEAAQYRASYLEKFPKGKYAKPKPKSSGKKK